MPNVYYAKTRLIRSIDSQSFKYKGTRAWSTQSKHSSIGHFGQALTLYIPHRTTWGGGARRQEQYMKYYFACEQDMRVRLWSPKMEAGATFDMSAFGPCPVVHSLCLSTDGTKLLVGVKGCEVHAWVYPQYRM